MLSLEQALAIKSPAAGRRLAISRLSSDFTRKELWVADAATAEQHLLRRDTDPVWVSHDIEPSLERAFSPDGEQIAFVSSATGWKHVYVAPPAVGEVRAVTRGEHENDLIGWAPDGRVRAGPHQPHAPPAQTALGGAHGRERADPAVRPAGHLQLGSARAYPPGPDHVGPGRSVQDVLHHEAGHILDGDEALDVLRPDNPGPAGPPVRAASGSDC